MNKDRLTTLANHLRTVPPEKLDMKNWTCNTAACAVGHAATMVDLITQGFYLAGGRIPAYGDLRAWAAVEAFFDIRWPAGRHLFDAQHYRAHPTPNEVADRIDYFVEHDGAVNIFGDLV